MQHLHLKSTSGSFVIAGTESEEEANCLIMCAEPESSEVIGVGVNNGVNNNSNGVNNNSNNNSNHPSPARLTVGQSAQNTRNTHGREYKKRNLAGERDIDRYCFLYSNNVVLLSKFITVVT